MIRFTCKNCGHGIKVGDKHAGKRGKCPRCKMPLVVPANADPVEASLIKFRCPNCQQKIGLKPRYAGKRVKCAKCRHPLRVPNFDAKPSAATGQIDVANGDAAPPVSQQDLALDWQGATDLLASLQESEANAPALAPAPAQEPEDTTQAAPTSDTPWADTPTDHSDTDQKAKRRLPWALDILLYPFSIGGVITIGIIVVGQLLAEMICCAGWVIQLLLLFYLAWYVSDCIRDTANGGVRAPDTIGRQESVFEMIGQFYRLLFCCVLYFSVGPLLYSLYLSNTNREANEAVQLSLIIVGGFLFPIGIIAVSVLESIGGLNPILLIRSVVRTFVPYCGLVLLFYGFILLYFFLVTGTALVGTQSGSTLILILLSFFIRLTFYWALLVAAHLLGCYYGRYTDKLGW